LPNHAAAPGGLVRGLWRLARPKQWTKNLLVFAAFLFSGAYADPQRGLLVLAAFAAMCLVSSATYAFNDLADVARDRLHPKKRTRPLASGQVSKQAGFVFGVALFAAGVLLAAWLGAIPLGIVAVYVLMQVAYNLGLKKTPIADVYTIALGFVLRAVLGAAAINVGISGWLLFCTGALALMLGFAKRRNEFILQGDERHTSRESLVHYNRAALDALVVLSACAAAIFYGIYCLESQTAQKYPAIILTSVFVYYGISRYVLIVFMADEGGEPADLLFKDTHLVTSLVLFVATAILAMSGFQLPIIER